MHIPDGYLSPQTAGGLWALMVPAWYWASHKAKKVLSARQAPLVAIGAAFTFVIMMFNVPLPGGTTGHAVGGTIVAIAIGPWAAVIAISVALVIQALFFGDGGILAIGANCFNIAFVLPVAGYFTYRMVSLGASPNSPRRWLAAGAGAYVGLNLAALLTAIEFGLQGDLFKAADGSALYSPYGLATAIPAMMVPHLLVVGSIEAVMSVLIYVFLMKTNAALLNNYAGMKAAASSFKLKPLIVGIMLLLVCTPLGLLAAGTAWGEWGPEDIQKQIGYIPEGIERFAGFWSGLLPDYGFPKSEEPPAAESGDTAPVADTSTATQDGGNGEGEAVSFGDVKDSAPAYLISGVLGVLLVAGVALMGVRLLTGRSLTRSSLAEVDKHHG